MLGHPLLPQQPHTSLWNVPQGKQQLLTADPGDWRKHLEKRRRAGDQRDPPKEHLLVPLQQAELAWRLFLALEVKVPTPAVS